KDRVHALTTELPLPLEKGELLLRGIVAQRVLGPGATRATGGACEEKLALCNEGIGDALLLLSAGEGVPCGDRVVSGALEHIEMVGLLGEHRDGLYPSRAAADDADSLSSQSDALLRPGARLYPLPPEMLQSRKIWATGGGQLTRCHHEKAAAKLAARA